MRALSACVGDRAKPAQSTLEYALIFPFLFVIILAIFELAFMWHSYNSLESAAQDVAANIVLSEGYGCATQDEMLSIVKRKTAILQEREISFVANTVDGVTTLVSNEQYKGKPFVTAKIDCYAPAGSVRTSPSVQLQSVHKMHFFRASLPNLRTGERIIIIPDNVMFTSSKIFTAGGI